MQTTDGNLSSSPLQKLNLMDDFLFDVTTVDLEACQIIIELSLNIRIREIRWKEGQKVVHNLPGKRGIRMDFYVEDMDGKVFNVEMQKRNRGHIPKRTRYYQGQIDALLLKSGEEGCDTRLIDLHNKVKQIKASEQMEVTYMKMEERDRQIREEGIKEGIKERTALLIRKKLAKGKKEEEIAEALEEEVSVVEALIAEMGGF